MANLSWISCKDIEAKENPKNGAIDGFYNGKSRNCTINKWTLKVEGDMHYTKSHFGGHTF